MGFHYSVVCAFIGLHGTIMAFSRASMVLRGLSWEFRGVSWYFRELLQLFRGLSWASMALSWGLHGHP